MSITEITVSDQQTEDDTSQCMLKTYISSLPDKAQSYLDKQLDWDNEGVDKDLDEIAKQMIDWEEKLSTLLMMPDYEIYDIKEENKRKRPRLQRYGCMGITTLR